ncbi:TlpA disulfide reductase family protein [Sphingobacterium sp. HMA12]|uniref:TlpA family protein disulfide reductase n=1 Tax=Sphingobacterium sp. HMA12 TaxID=2050894 RepID=UPI000CEA663C|nr:TlpA disulfide reductase family protein [Sphingobacterium sp. HMA12]
MKRLKLQSNNSVLLNIQILKIAVLVILYFLVSMFSLSAQTPRKDSGADGLSIKSLKVGDSIPTDLWNLPLTVINDHKGNNTIKLSNFKSKKLIIIDFWATWCAPCIKMLPKLEGYRSIYGQDIAILAVTDESKEKIQTFSARSNNPVFTVYEDQILKRYFPRHSLPHSIWIADGKLLLSNSSDYITDSNIQKAIQRKTIAEFKKPAFADYEDSINLKNFLKEKVITQYGSNRAFYRSFNWHIGRLKTTKSYLRYLNGAIEDMLYKLYSRDIPHYGRFNRLVYDIPDSVRERLCYDYEKFASMPIVERSKWNFQWKKDHYYCYEFINIDSTTDLDPKTIFREDLRSFLLEKFGVSFSLQPMLRKQYLITVYPSNKTLKGLKTENFFDPNTRKARFVNIPLENILGIIAEQNKHNPIPIVWDKAYTEQLYSIDFACSLQDLPTVFAILKKHGIHVELCEHPLLSIHLTQAATVGEEVSDEN